MLKNNSCMNTITNRRLMATSMRDFSETGFFLSDTLSRNFNGIEEGCSKAVSSENLAIKKSHCSSIEKNQAQAAIHSQTLAVKNILHYY